MPNHDMSAWQDERDVVLTLVAAEFALLRDGDSMSEAGKALKLEAGAVYVIESEYRLSREAMQRMHDELTAVAPECRFLILDQGLRIAREKATDASEVCVGRAET